MYFCYYFLTLDGNYIIWAESVNLFTLTTENFEFTTGSGKVFVIVYSAFNEPVILIGNV